MRHLTGAGLLLAASLLLRQALLSRAGLRRRTLRALAESFLSLARDVHLTLTPLPALQSRPEVLPLIWPKTLPAT